MVESEADILPEDVMLGAVVYGHDQMQVVINAINEFVEEAGKPEWDWAPAAKNEELVAKLNALVEADLQEAFRITSKQQRTKCINEISKKAIEVLTAGEGAPDATTISNLFFDVEAKIVRSHSAGEPRIDGSRHAYRAPDRHSLQRLAAHARFCPVYPWRNPGIGCRDVGYRS